MKRIFEPVNKNAQPCVKNVLKFLSDISGDKIVVGQHTQDMEQPELKKIIEVTGKEPGLLGFELLSYSPNINYIDTDEECMIEVTDNRGTLQRAWEWAEKKGLLTFTWHWFSPLYGRSKSFFTENTEFDIEKAVTPGTPEYIATISDIDTMAGILRPFCDKQIPILWRPLHEGEGKWFWWGAKGPEPLKALYKMMYDRFTNIHHLNNLIWVWNATLIECYPGDDVVDIITRDMYPKGHDYTDRRGEYDGMLHITQAPKLMAVGESGVVLDADMVHANKTEWTYFMTWSHEFSLSEEYNSSEFLNKLYHSEYAVTLDKLPKLY